MNPYNPQQTNNTQAGNPQPWYMQPWQQYRQGTASQTIPQNGYQQMQQVQQTQPGFQVIPVSSYDEAKTIPTDFMGTLLILPDITHGFIYTNVFNPTTGSAIFSVYKHANLPDSTIQNTAPAPVDDYDAREEIAQLRKELDDIKKELGIIDKEN